MAASDIILTERKMCYPFITIGIDIQNDSFSCSGYIPLIENHCKFWRYGEIQLLEDIPFDKKKLKK